MLFMPHRPTGIALRISRGRFSYLHPEREKYISARKLGTDFDQAHLLSIFAENAKTKTQKPQVRVQPEYDPSFDYLSNPEAALVFHSDLHLVVDLQSNLKAQQSAAYARKVTLSNLREAAKTLCYIQEHGYDSREELEAAFAASPTGLVKRSEYLEVPIRVEYELTEKARQLQPILTDLIRWALADQETK